LLRSRKLAGRSGEAEGNCKDRLNRFQRHERDPTQLQATSSVAPPGHS
jgi:hypothetical protein